jgi:hypothetical protein
MLIESMCTRYMLLLPAVHLLVAVLVEAPVVVAVVIVVEMVEAAFLPTQAPRALTRVRKSSSTKPLRES